MDSEWSLIIPNSFNQIISSPEWKVTSGRQNRNQRMFNSPELSLSRLIYFFPELWKWWWGYPALAEFAVCSNRQGVHLGEWKHLWFFFFFFSLDFLSLLGEFSWGEVRLSFTSIPEGLWYDVRRKEENRGYRLYHCRCWDAGSCGHCDDSGLCHLALGEQIHLNEL